MSRSPWSGVESCPGPGPGAQLLYCLPSSSTRLLPEATQAGALQFHPGLSIFLVPREEGLTSLWGPVLFHLMGKETGPEAALTPSSPP